MTVELRPGESFDNLLKRFRKEVTKSRILSTYRRKRWYVSKSELRRAKKKKAIRKARRKLFRRKRQGARGRQKRSARR
jgi:small subunit ribosomal protein S21